jgi:hypothetical protein
LDLREEEFLDGWTDLLRDTSGSARRVLEPKVKQRRSLCTGDTAVHRPSYESILYALNKAPFERG